MVYKIDDVVVYGCEGICKIAEITEMSFGSDDKKSQYYILTPISSKGAKVFVPCDNEMLVSKMQNVLSAKDIEEMISSVDELPEWISDNRNRNKAFKEILQTYDRKKILSLAKLLCIVKKEKDPQRRMLASDEEILKKVIRILHAEFSMALKIEIDQVVPYIFKEIKCEQK